MLTEIKIGNRTYPLIFGIKFIREMDKRYQGKNEKAGLSYGFGLGMATVYIEQRNPVILMDLIQAATITEKTKPSVDEIEAFLEATDTNLEKLFKDFLLSLEKSPLTQPMMKHMADAKQEETNAKSEE